MLSGGKLACGNPKDGRVKDDWYATDPKAVDMLLDDYNIFGTKFLEPCVGAGHIAKVLKRRYQDDVELTCVDIVDRGYPGTIIHDFLTWETDEMFDAVVSNPPYSMAQEFIEKSLDLVGPHGTVVMFLKVQFLEGEKRREFFERYPPAYVYVFSKRMPTWNNGREFDPRTGRRWATTMCHAWFVWEKGNTYLPEIKWL